jgi:hypothetical protein
MCCCSSGNGCGGCKAILGIVALFLTATTIAALLGVYNAHMTADGFVFGALNGSASLATFILSLVAWLKVVKKMCPCKSACGMCPGCGTKPCSCK